MFTFVYCKRYKSKATLLATRTTIAAITTLLVLSSPMQTFVCVSAATIFNAKAKVNTQIHTCVCVSKHACACLFIFTGVWQSSGCFVYAVASSSSLDFSRKPCAHVKWGWVCIYIGEYKYIFVAVCLQHFVSQFGMLTGDKLPTNQI